MRFWFDESETPYCSNCGYFTHESTLQVAKVSCPTCGREVLDFSAVVSRSTASKKLLALIPESLGRECCVIPYDQDSRGLVVLRDILDAEYQLDKLTFVLNQQVTCLHAERGLIMQLIERSYSKT